MESSTDRLTPLQRECLAAFFATERGFFLTGGAALAGFYLLHRQTSDLDLFTRDADAFERGAFVLQTVADRVGAVASVRQDAPGFRRYVLNRSDESVVVDLVLERVPAAYDRFEVRAGVILDVPEEIFVNKLTTLVSRSEIRDLVDLMWLERSGNSLEAALPKALTKDGGCTPAALAWVLSGIQIADEARLPGGVEPSVLRAFLRDLIERLLRLADPASLR